MPLQVLRGRNFICKIHGDVMFQIGGFYTKKLVKVGPILTPLPKESRNLGQMGRKVGKNHGKSFENGHKL